MAITFDKLNKYVIISMDVTEITIQEIYDAIRDFEDEVINIEVPKIGDCYGKQDLGGGVLVGLTLVLYEWTLKFADRPGPTWDICTISGGNLVAYDVGGNAVSPITPSSFITTNITASSSATMISMEGSVPTADDVAVAVWDKILAAGVAGTVMSTIFDDVAYIRLNGTGGEGGMPSDVIDRIRKLKQVLFGERPIAP